MKVSGARHCETWDPPPAPWSKFAVMGLQVCFQASKRTFHSCCTFRACPARPGAVRGTFRERDCIRPMNFSFMRRPISRAALWTRAASVNLRMKRAIVFPLEILRGYAGPMEQCRVRQAHRQDASCSPGTQKEQVPLMHHAAGGRVILISSRTGS